MFKKAYFVTLCALVFIAYASTAQAELKAVAGGGSGTDTYGNLPPAAGISTFLTTPSGANFASALTSPVPASVGGTGATSLGNTLAVSGNVLNTTQIINAQGTAASYTVLSTDMGKTVTHSKSTAVAEALPQAGTTGFGAGVSYSEINIGAGTVTITPTTSTINGQSSLALAQYQSAYIISDGTNWLAFLGVSSASAGLTVGSSTISSGSTGKIEYNNGGTLGEYAISGTGTVAMTASPTFTGTVTLAKSAPNVIVPANNAISVTSNAGTASASYYLNTFTNSSAATMAITISTSGATDGQAMLVRIYDFSGAAETIGWTNTENSGVSAPTTSNGSTTLPLTVGFIYNGQTSKWRCIGSE